MMETCVEFDVHGVGVISWLLVVGIIFGGGVFLEADKTDVGWTSVGMSRSPVEPKDPLKEWFERLVEMGKELENLRKKLEELSKTVEDEPSSSERFEELERELIKLGEELRRKERIFREARFDYVSYYVLGTTLSFMVLLRLSMFVYEIAMMIIDRGGGG